MNIICIQLDKPGSFELIKNKLFLILMSNIFFNFFQINIKEKLHVLHVAPHSILFRMHIDGCTACFFLNFYKHDFLQVYSTEQVTPSSGQTIEYMLNPCRASMKHVAMHSV